VNGLDWYEVEGATHRDDMDFVEVGMVFGLVVVI